MKSKKKFFRNDLLIISISNQSNLKEKDIQSLIEKQVYLTKIFV